jgi:hypothetical protein
MTENKARRVFQDVLLWAFNNGPLRDDLNRWSILERPLNREPVRPIASTRQVQQHQAWRSLWVLSALLSVGIILILVLTYPQDPEGFNAVSTATSTPLLALIPLALISLHRANQVRPSKSTRFVAEAWNKLVAVCYQHGLADSVIGVFKGLLMDSDDKPCMWRMHKAEMAVSKRKDCPHLLHLKTMSIEIPVVHGHRMLEKYGVQDVKDLPPKIISELKDMIWASKVIGGWQCFGVADVIALQRKIIHWEQGGTLLARSPVQSN